MAYNKPWFKEKYGITLPRFCYIFHTRDIVVKQYLEDRTRVRPSTALKLDAAFQVLSEMREEVNAKHGDGEFEQLITPQGRRPYNDKMAMLWAVRDRHQLYCKKEEA